MAEMFLDRNNGSPDSLMKEKVICDQREWTMEKNNGIVYMNRSGIAQAKSV